MDSLGSLPCELRLLIYSYVFSTDGGPRIPFRVSSRPEADMFNPSYLLLAYTNRLYGNAWPEHVKQALLQGSSGRLCSR